MSNRVRTFNLSCFSLRSTFSNLATDFWLPDYSMPREYLIAKPGELPTFSLTILIAQKLTGKKSTVWSYLFRIIALARKAISTNALSPLGHLEIPSRKI